MSAHESPTPEDELADPQDAVAGDPIKSDPDEPPPLREGAPLNNGQTRQNLRLS